MPIELIRVTSAHMAEVQAQIARRKLTVSMDILDDEEIALFNRFMNKMVVIHGNDRRWIDFHLNHIGDYLLGLGTAKKQFGGAKFGGSIPAGGEFGIDQWRAGYCNVGQDWNAEGTTVAATAKNWIHAGGVLISGVAGTDIRFLEGFVGVIAGFGDYRQQVQGKYSEIECFQIRMDNRLLKPLYVGQNLKLGDYPVVELDEQVICKDRTQLRIQYVSELASVNVPFLVGVCYAMEGSFNKIAAVDLDGTSNKLYETA